MQRCVLGVEAASRSVTLFRIVVSGYDDVLLLCNSLRCDDCGATDD